MESASFVGIFSIRVNNGFPALQSHDFSGACYAWKKEDGEHIVLPANGNAPNENCYILDARDFEFLFQPYAASSTSPLEATPRPSLRSDAPDLLGMWYEESLTAVPDATVQQPQSPPSGMDGLVAAELSSDEAVLAPAWHPDELFAEPGSRGAMPQGPAARAFHRAAEMPPQAFHTPGHTQGHTHGHMPGHISGYDTPAAPSRTSYPASPPHTGFAAPPPHAQAQVLVNEVQEDPEIRSAHLEQRMRGKFDALLGQMTESPSPELEEELARLLTLGSTFSWKQKFMFTEFGLALRRKQKFQLALSSHLRALQLAPNDEHILFNVARAEYELGNTAKAQEYLGRALAVAPDFTVAKNFQGFLLGRA